jgi:protein SCO1/2
MSRRSALIVIIALALLALGSAWVTITLTTNRVPEQALSSSAQIGGSFTLGAADGRTVTDQTYRGKWLLIYFGYTFCPDACPTALNNMSEALDNLGADASDIQPLFITVDPKRDTPQVMADYLKSFDSRTSGSLVVRHRPTAWPRRTGSMSRRRRLMETTISSIMAPMPMS